MAAEKQYTLDTIANLKRALETPSDVSDSDDSIAYTSNRGRKLKHRARFVHEGSLDDSKGPRVYKQEVEYFGKRRKIIYRKGNHRRREANSDEEHEDSEGDVSGRDDLDPYAGVDLEKLLTPVVCAADLPSHPALAQIYTAPTLKKLIQQSLEKSCEEHEHTTKVKNLLTTFLGDDTFLNLEKMEWPSEDHEAAAKKRSEELLRELRGLSTGNGTESASGPSGGENAEKFPEINGKNTKGEGENEDHEMQISEETNGHENPVHASEDREMPDCESDTTPNNLPTLHINTTNINTTEGSPSQPLHPVMEDSSQYPGSKQSLTQEDITTSQETTPPPARRMTTRSTINNPPTPPPIPESPPVEIDPFFFPPSYRVDRNFGLPVSEAEDTRRLLLAAVQRQEEFLRGLQKVRNGLLRAERLKKLVWEWCRTMEGMRDYHQHLAEVSCNRNGGGIGGGSWNVDEGEGVGLSDGEDWYDRDAWGLEEELEKGKEEEDEGADVPQGKKTRGRRTAGN